MYFLQVSPNVLAKSFMHDYLITAASFGGLISFYYYAYSLMQVPAGILMDRYGARKLLMLAAIICGLSTMILSLTHSFVVAEWMRLFTGMGSAFVFIGACWLFARWFNSERFSFLTGVISAVGMIGGICASAPLSVFISHLGWRVTMFLYGLLGLLIGFLIFSFVRDYPKKAEVGLQQCVIQTVSIFSRIKDVVLNKENWLCGLYAGLFFVPTVVIGMVWGIPYLESVYHISSNMAAAVVTSIFFGWMIGSQLFGWLLGRTHFSRGVLIWNTVAALLCILPVIYLNFISLKAVSVCLFFFGFFSGAEPLVFVFVRMNNPEENMATAIGFANTLCMLLGAVLPMLVGRILDLNWDGKLIHGVHIYSTHNYQLALSLIPLSLLLSTFVMRSITPIRRRFLKAAEVIPAPVSSEPVSVVIEPVEPLHEEEALPDERS